MIIVVGSHHDSVAVELTRRWPNAALLSAEDLVSPGWVWSGDGARQQWVVGGQVVDDRAVSGVFLRRNRVLPEELIRIHPDDRAYLAAETQALLIAMLGSSSATVVNPVGDGALGEEVVGPEVWLAAAGALGLAVQPLTLSSHARQDEAHVGLVHVEVVAKRGFGNAPSELVRAAVELVDSVGLLWALCAFDEQGRLVALSPSASPSLESITALGELLERSSA